MTNKSARLYPLIIGFLLLIVAGWYISSRLPQPETEPLTVDGQRAYTDVETQVAFGPRVPGSDGHAKIQEWMREELVQAGWQVEVQKSEALGHPIQNIVAKRSDEPPQIIIGAHYDSRIFADHDLDPSQRTNYVP